MHVRVTSQIASVVVLAAGQGKRMKSTLPKVLHPVCGRPMLLHVLDAARAVQAERIVVVLGHGHEQVRPYLPPDVRGGPAGAATGHRSRGPGGRASRYCPGPCSCCPGDTPLVTGEVLQALVRDHFGARVAATVLTMDLDDPTGYGRIVRDADGSLAAHRRASRRDAGGAGPPRGQQLHVRAARARRPSRYCERCGSDNDQEEIYLTDVIAGLRARGREVAASQGGRPHPGAGGELAGGAGRGGEAHVPASAGRGPATVIPYVSGEQDKEERGMTEREPRRCARMTPERSLMVFSGRGNPELSAKVADKLGIELGRVDIKTFADGEIYVKYGESIRGADVFIIQPTCRPVNENLMELLIMTQAARLASAHRVTAVIPWMGYSRQDKKSCPREPITARLVADIMQAAGVDRVVTMDLHAGQLQGFFSVPVDHMTALSMIADYFKMKNLERHGGGLARRRRHEDGQEDGRPPGLLGGRAHQVAARAQRVAGDVRHRRGGGQDGHHRRRHHRHRRQRGERRCRRSWTRGPRRSTRPAPTRCCPTRRTSASRPRRSKRWWSPTPSRCARG